MPYEYSPGTSLNLGGLFAAVVNGGGISYLMSREGRGSGGADMMVDLLGGILVFGMASVTENLVGGVRGQHRLFVHHTKSDDDKNPGLSIQWTSWLTGGLLNGLGILVLDAMGFEPATRSGGVTVIVGGFLYIVSRSTYGDIY